MHDLAGIAALVVDDNATNIRIVSEMLAQWGMQVVEALDAEAALRAAQEAPRAFGLIVADMHLPGMTGLDLAGSLRAHPRCASAPVVILTSSDRPDEPRKAAALADVSYVVKPVGHSMLLETVRQTLGARTGNDSQPAAPAVTPTRAARALRVLVAEDNTVNQRLTDHLLRRRGHTPTIVGNGRLAVEALARETFDLVLMDLQMPEMDGFEATAAIRASEAGSERHLRIVAMTAHAMDGDREKCLAAGMDDYVSKPIRRADLIAALGRNKALEEAASD
jgi:CheY-like chemotaxis protein